MKALIATGLLLTSISAFAQPTVRCDLVSEESLENYVSISSSSFEASGNGAQFNYAGKKYDIYADTRIDQKTNKTYVYISILTPNSVVSGRDQLNYYDIEGRYSIDCSLK